MPSDEQITNALIQMISDGFNRSLGSLRDAGAVDTSKLDASYRLGSRFYDLVTRQITVTAEYAMPTLRELFDDDDRA